MPSRQIFSLVLVLGATALAVLGLLLLADRGTVGMFGLIFLVSAAGLVLVAFRLFLGWTRRPRRPIGRREYQLGNVLGAVLGVSCVIYAAKGLALGEYPGWGRRATMTRFAEQPFKYAAKLTISGVGGAALLWFFLPPLLPASRNEDDA